MYCSTCLTDLSDKRALTIDHGLSEGGPTLRDALHQIGVSNWIPHKVPELLCLPCVNCITTAFWFKERTESFVKLFYEWPGDITDSAQLCSHFDPFRKNAKEELRQISLFLTQPQKTEELDLGTDVESETLETFPEEMVHTEMLEVIKEETVTPGKSSKRKAKSQASIKSETNEYDDDVDNDNDDDNDDDVADDSYKPGGAKAKKANKKEMELPEAIIVDGLEVFKCAHCPRDFLARHRLMRHMSATHAESIKFVTASVRRKTKKVVLEALVPPAAEGGVLLCPECGKSFTNRTLYMTHKRRHEGIKPFKCSFCGKVFTRCDDLRVHERYHTGVKPYVCDVCNKAFPRKFNMVIHKRIHTGERPHQCTYCDRSFVQRNDLKTHLRRHTGERFKCNLCPEEFLMQYHLTRHKKDVHQLKVTVATGRLEKFEVGHE